MNSRKRSFAFFCIISLFAMTSCFAHPVTPALIVDRHLDNSMFGVALAAMNTMSFLFSPFWGKLCGYIPSRRIMLVCCVGYAAGQLIFASAYTEWVVMVGRLFAGVFTGGIFTAGSIYIINTSATAEKRGQNLTIMVTLQNVMNAIG